MISLTSSPGRYEELFGKPLFRVIGVGLFT